MLTNCIILWLIVLQLSTIKLCKSARTCNDKDLFRTSVYDTRPFWYGLFRINIFKVRFWEGGHTKEYAVYAHENDDNYGRPLIQYQYLETSCNALVSEGLHSFMCTLLALPAANSFISHWLHHLSSSSMEVFILYWGRVNVSHWGMHA